MPDRRIFEKMLGALLLAGSLAAQSTVAPAVSPAAAARFLEQASWGPTQAAVAAVEAAGFSRYIDAQFAAPLSALPDVPPNAMGREPMFPVQQQFFVNARTGADQLRQRVAFALSQIWVVSAVKLHTADEVVPYLRLLQKDAFANYYQIMADVTLSPSMGHYLDMVNNDKPNPAVGKEADENYARELLQLFTIGLNELNDDGTLQLSNGEPIATYDQTAIQGFARAFTGWTYPPKPGATVSRIHNPPYFEGQMVAFDSNHDMAAKTLLDGVTLSGGQGAHLDLTDALQNIFRHHNVAPFVSRQLIQHLVTGNPSPDYVRRVVTVFRSSNGDMKAVVKAILLDPEARAGDAATPDAGEGHLREPVLFISALLRALNATVTADNTLAVQANSMGQDLYFSPSVFNYFSPGYRFTADGNPVPVNAPEFQILSTSTAMLRAGFVNRLVYGKIPGVSLDWTPYVNLTADQLLNTLNARLMRGAMSQAMRGAILTAVNAQNSNLAKAQAAVYLIATSSQYQVER